MPLDGWKTLGSALPIADSVGSAHLYQAFASARTWIADECLPRFTHLFHDEAAVPATGPKSSNAPPFQRLVLTSLAWRCVPFLWRFSPVARTLTVRIHGDLVDATMEMVLQLAPSYTPTNATTQTVANDKTVDLTVRVPREYRGTVHPVLIFYRSAVDLSATVDSGNAYQSPDGDSYWLNPVNPAQSGVIYGVIRNCDDSNPAPVYNSDELKWSAASTPDWLPAQIIAYKDAIGTVLADPRQIVQINQGVSGATPGGYAVVLNPPFLEAVNAFGTPAGYFLWETYALGAFKVSALNVWESSS